MLQRHRVIDVAAHDRDLSGLHAHHDVAMRGVVPARQVVVADDALPGEARVTAAAEQVLSGQRRGIRAVLPFLGPAFIAAVRVASSTG